MTHTKDLLAEALQQIGLQEMAIKARSGYYHEFMSPLDMPEMQLAADLADVGTPEAMALRERVLDGDFEASDAESEEWAASPEGQAMMAQLINKTPL